MNKQQFMKAFGYRTVSLTNILTNGNFASTSGWGNNGASFSVSGNEAIFLANSQTDSVYRGDVTYVNEHIYYLCGWIKSSSPLVRFVTWWNNLEASAYSAGSGNYEFLSTLYTANQSTSTGQIYPLYDIRSSGWDEIRAKYFSIIDLTAAFGAGKEPNKEQMDWLMQQYANRWLDGTQNANYYW